MRKKAGSSVLVGFLLSLSVPALAQEMDKLLQVKTAQPKPAYLATDKVVAPDETSAATRTEKPESEMSWYWRFIKGALVSTAIINKQNESDGRPEVPGRPQ